jgi:DNA adenine methylase
MKPPLKWAGGKRWLAPLLKPVFDHYQNHRWCEPFAGSAALAFIYEPTSVYLNDNLPPLINFYSCLTMGQMDQPLPSLTDTEYYQCRQEFNRHNSGTNASLFYMLNYAGFNGLYRVNSKGQFNVPYGGERKIPHLDIPNYARLMQDWILTCHDFRRALEMTELTHQSQFIPSCIAYIDPPYDDGFTDYSGQFSWKDRIELIEILSKASFPLVYSERATNRVCEVLYDHGPNGFEWLEIEGPRRISADGDRTPAKEVLAFRNIDGHVMEAVNKLIHG